MEENKMTVSDFIKIYDEDMSKNKIAAKSSLTIKPYISYSEKVNTMNALVTTVNMNEDIVQVNSPVEYVLYVKTIINMYTNINVSTDNGFDDFDALNSRGLIEFIFNLIPEKEIKEFDRVLEMCRNDLMMNNYEIHSFINNLYYRIKSDSTAITIPLIELINEAKQKLGEIDADELAKAIQALSAISPLINE